MEIDGRKDFSDSKKEDIQRNRDTLQPQSFSSQDKCKLIKKDGS
jgi:hypothetical protein